MTEFLLSYREVIPDQTILEPWKEINVNTGGTQSILQDIKFIDRANGFCYSSSNKHYTTNRFIYWRTSNDILELVEHSLDINLSGNRIKYKFIDTPILDGISVHETSENVIVLVPTVCSVHRLVFPHPDKYHRSDDLLGLHTDLSAPSIFSEVRDSDSRSASSYYMFSGPSSANSQLPHLASSSLTREGKAIFVLIYPSGELLLVWQNVDGENGSMELKSESMVPRFLSGLADKFRSKMNDGDNIVSAILHLVGSETYVIILTRNAFLKFWSCKKAQCISVINVLSETGDYSSNLMQGDQNHILRKAVNGEGDDCVLSTFLCFTNQKQFHMLKPTFEEGHVRVTRIDSLSAPQNDLIDFNLTLTRIWSVWRTEHGDCGVYSASLQQNEIGTKNWMPVVLEDPPENQPPQIDGESDPGQIYLQYIFNPGRFPLHIINKALNIYRRSAVSTELNLSPNLLKQRISSAIHSEIRKELKEAEVSDEEYLECANWCWQRFYSNCVQYHIAGLKPLGILLLPGVSGAVLLKKSTFSFFRPLDTLEHMLLCCDYMSVDQFVNKSCFGEGSETISEVMSLMEVIVYLDSQMSEIFGHTFERELLHLRSPDVIMDELLSKIVTEMDSKFTSQVAKMLDDCHDLYHGIHKLLELLRDEHNLLRDGGEQKGDSSLTHLFNSQLGVSVITQCLNQQAKTRFTICRNLLLVCNILLKRKDIDWNMLEAIRSVCMPDIVVLTQASFAVLWLSTLPSLPTLPQELSLRRLSPIKLTPVFNLRNSSTSLISILELFIGSTGGDFGHKQFAQNRSEHENFPDWHFSLLPYLSHLFHIIWPVSGCSILAEWLLSSGQHVWLQQYVRLLKDWCEWNNCTRNFLLACSFLITSENFKAMSLFESAAKGIFTDAFLSKKILKHSVQEDQNKSYISYYLKVIQLFELNNVSDCAIEIANTALSVVTDDDPLAATLYSIKFKHHLKLKHYLHAYDSLNSNPDEERKRDNLRDLVKCLLDDRKLDTLMSFNYGKLEELFCEILLSRARAIESPHNLFYDFLYAYHIKRGPGFLRLAGSVMYEQAFRLSYNNSPDSLEKQVKCLLAAINVLSLCNEKFAWVARPKDPEDREVIVLPSKIGSNESNYEIVLENQIEVVGLKDIRRDFEFACAKLKLAKFSPELYNNLTVTSPSELTVALTASGLFQVSLLVCKEYNLPYEPVFEALTKQCILLTEDEDPVSGNWQWLLKNDTQDLLVNSNSPSDVAWLLLEDFLKSYEQENMSRLHKAVCKKIIQMGAYIPHWILVSYKMRNAAELLRLLHSCGRLQEAVEVACECMLAIMGHGKEHYGIKMSLCSTGPVMCSPASAIYTLILELKAQVKLNKEEDFSKEYDYLNDLFTKYVEMATRISNEMCKYRFSIAK